MGREVRMVPKDWQHPKDDSGKYVPLYDGKGGKFAQADAEWNEQYAKWQQGLCQQYGDIKPWGAIDPEYKNQTCTQYYGARPSPDDYMPDWTQEQRTHYMMYEDTSEGTPISPAFATPEELARWLADTGASSFGRSTASYESWLNVCKGAFAPSAIYTPSTGLIDGVTATTVIAK